MSKQQGQTEGLATVEIPPHKFDNVSASDKGELTVLKLHDNLESIGISLILTTEARERIVDELQD